MDIGLIGLPRSGKTTIFNLLTYAHIETSAFGGKAQSRRGLAPVPDERLLWLKNLYQPQKLTPAQLQVVDVPGLSHGESVGPNRFLNDVRLVDALIHVVRGYTSELGEQPTPLKDIEEMELEIALSDLDLVEKRRERLTHGKKMTQESRHELELIAALHTALESGQRLDQLDLSADDRRLLSGYQFLTLKPMIWLLNLDDQAFQTEQYPDREIIRTLSVEKEIPFVLMAGALEQEIQDLDEADRIEFMHDLGIRETGTARLARAAYDHLGLISFLTAGEDEVRAWTIQRGTPAKEAAGKIHSDIERGFIRAEVVAFEALKAAGTMNKARDGGKVRLEGKEYVVQDGDVVNFRFNV